MPQSKRFLATLRGARGGQAMIAITSLAKALWIMQRSGSARVRRASSSARVLPRRYARLRPAEPRAEPLVHLILIPLDVLGELLGEDVRRFLNHLLQHLGRGLDLLYDAREASDVLYSTWTFSGSFLVRMSAASSTISSSTWAAGLISFTMPAT